MIAATVFGFWRSYFAILPTAPLGFHIHGLTASLWMLLLLAQSYTPHRARVALHRTVGRATFVAIPLFAAGAMGVAHSMSVGTAGDNPFYELWGAPLGWIDMLAFGAVLYAAGMALRHRRNVRLHAGYMLSTALPLAGPVLGRIVNQTVPGLTIKGPQDFPLFGAGVQLAYVVFGLFALWLWRRDPRIGRPWAVAFAVVVVQIVTFETVGASATWRAAFEALAPVPLPALMALGLAIGGATVFAGWTAPGDRARPAAA
ncbi:hypothetical protein [Glacieibacterium frigidum]|uniref:Uncharacterized protein n=1 Tax=Glacieibacterium frigidum TaxID=2593303 RepID=A0A552UI21_9SPHN|nr:hypothetical protein [Glacieibacterium frigidum]TRW17875.1 hypothetical protein FMM06_07045 [Glacieibacterium frigidum]